jgi:hypothetical protein
MFSEKAPFIVTLIIAGMAWTLSHIIDQLLATPMLLYSTQVINTGGKKSVYLTLKNITRDKTYRDVRVIITAAPGDTLADRAVIPVQPAWEGDQSGMREGRTFDYTFPEIQPNWQFEMTASYKTQSTPSLRISSSNGTIDTVTPSVETFLVENEIKVCTQIIH